MQPIPAAGDSAGVWVQSPIYIQRWYLPKSYVSTERTAVKLNPGIYGYSSPIEISDLHT